MANEVIKKEVSIVDRVQSKINSFIRGGELTLHPSYNAPNALKSAWLIIQETVDMSRKPALEVTTKASQANALLNMVLQGLDPVKKQCYFIVYGNKLVMQPSYFGRMHTSKMVDATIADIFGEVVYKGDDFKYEKILGKTQIVKHEQKLENIDKNNIIAAYGVIVYTNGTHRAEIMTMPEIKAAWAKSRANPFDDNGNLKTTSTHAQYTADMCRKTAISKVCKFVINSSDDSNLTVRSYKETEAEITDAELAEDIAENANTETLTIDAPQEAPATTPAATATPTQATKTAADDLP